MKYLLLLSFVCLTARQISIVSADTLDDFERDEGIVVLKGHNFQEALEHFDNVLVEFYAPWCGHCKAFAPDYVKIAAILKEKGQSVACAKVDATEEQELFMKHDIQDYPTLKLFRKEKKPDPYRGSLSVYKLVDWVTRKIGPSAQVIEDSESADKLKESADIVVIAYYKDAASNESLTFSDIANQFEDYKFGFVQKEDLATKLGFTREGVKLFKKFDKSEVDYDKDLKSSAELKRFIFQMIVNQFNENLLPIINQTVHMEYFKYVRVNLNRPCTLKWCDDWKCNNPDCGVKTLDDPNKCPNSTYHDNNELSTVNTKLASGQLDRLIKFECNVDDHPDSQWVDLLLNPERYTGYKGKHARRIWRAIYEENCFASRSPSPFLQELCYEERLFYEAISGLHASINIHLCAEYPSNVSMFEGILAPSLNERIFKPNWTEYQRRFQGHDDYIDNLYKLFLIELQALAKSKPYFLKRIGWPNSLTEDAIQRLFTVVDKFKHPNDVDFSLKPSHISTEMTIHFRNITTTIIDCVGCDKCKLWGKVQLRGLGTAFNILSLKEIGKLRLNQQDIVSFINSIARLSHSISYLEQFRSPMVKNEKSVSMDSSDNFKDEL